MKIYEKYCKLANLVDILPSNNYYDSCVQLMDDDIRESLHNRLANCSNAEFLQAYCIEHLAKFGEEFEC